MGLIVQHPRMNSVLTEVGVGEISLLPMFEPCSERVYHNPYRGVCPDFEKLLVPAVREAYGTAYIVWGDTRPEPGGYLSGHNVRVVGIYEFKFAAVIAAWYHCDFARNGYGAAWIQKVEPLPKPKPPPGPVYYRQWTGPK